MTATPIADEGLTHAEDATGPTSWSALGCSGCRIDNVLSSGRRWLDGGAGTLQTALAALREPGFRGVH